MLHSNLYQGIAQQIGTTDEVTTCYCCGKQNLKRTVVFSTTPEWQYNGGDDFVFLGTTCASRKAKGYVASKAKAVNHNGQWMSAAEAENEQCRDTMRMTILRYEVQQGGEFERVLNWVRSLNNDRLIDEYNWVKALVA